MSNDSGWLELTIDNYWQLLIIAVSSKTGAYREALLTCLVINLSFMFRCTPTFSYLRQLARFTRFLLVVQLIGVCIPVTVIEMAYFFRKVRKFWFKSQWKTDCSFSIVFSNCSTSRRFDNNRIRQCIISSIMRHWKSANRSVMCHSAKLNIHVKPQTTCKIFPTHSYVTFAELRYLYCFRFTRNWTQMSTLGTKARNKVKCWKSHFSGSFSPIWSWYPLFSLGIHKLQL